MSTHEEAKLSHDDLNEHQIAEYLRDHPDFFIRNTALLSEINIPHQTGNAVSLVEHQLHVLRDQNRQLKQKLTDLVNVARENDRLAERIMQLTLRLMECQSLDEGLQVLDDNLREDFKADFVRLHLLPAPGMNLPDDRMTSDPDALREAFDHFIKTGRPLCGRLKQNQLEIIFSECANEVGSSVLIPLGRRSEYGMLAIGSRDEHRYHPGMGTIFLKQIGALLTSLLRCYASR